MVPVVEALAAAAAARAPCGSRSTRSRPRWPRPRWPPGRRLVNDISASLWEVAAAAGAGWVAMHMQGEPRTMQDDPRYGDVVAEVQRLPAGAGRRGRWRPGWREVWVDPGIGFGKTPAHNLSLLRHLPELVGRRRGAGCAGVLVGHQPQALPRACWPRARAGDAGAASADRAEGSLATAAAALVAGAGMVRVHDVAATVQVARLYGPAA